MGERMDLSIIRNLPEMVLPLVPSTSEMGRVLEVARIATASPVSAERLAWIETTDGVLLRLPEVLHAWAYDMVAFVLAHGGNDVVRLFPAKVEFGILDDRAYAEIL